jgi:hypothetical protein
MSVPVVVVVAPQRLGRVTTDPPTWLERASSRTERCVEGRPDGRPRRTLASLSSVPTQRAARFGWWQRRRRSFERASCKRGEVDPPKCVARRAFFGPPIIIIRAAVGRPVDRGRVHNRRAACHPSSRTASVDPAFAVGCAPHGRSCRSQQILPSLGRPRRRPAAAAEEGGR